MIRHSPAEKYIEYLLVHPDGYDDDTIIEMLRLKQLDPLGPAYLGRLRRNLRPPDPFVPQNKLHAASSRFLARTKLQYLFHPDSATKCAEKILRVAQAKEIAEAMLITRDPLGLIAHRLKTFGVNADVKAVERFRFFFFNVDLCDTAELGALLRLRSEFIPQLSDDYEDQMRKAMKSSSYNDPRRAAIAHENPQLASMFTSLRLGYMPSRVELARMLNAGRYAATARSLMSVQSRHPNAANEAASWAITAKSFNELLQDVGSPDSELQKDMQALALQTDDSKIPSIAELSGGNHTTDLQPIEAREVPDE